MAGWVGQAFADEIMRGSGGEGSGCVPGTTFSYNGDHPSGVTYACDSSGNPIAGSTSGSVSVDADKVEITAINSYLQFAVDATEAPSSALTVFFDLYVPDDGDVGTNAIIEIYGDANNYLYAYTNNITNAVRAKHNGNGDGDDFADYSESAVTLGTWMSCAVSFSTTLGAFSASVDGGSTWGDASVTMTEWTTSIARITIGENTSQTSSDDDIQIRNIAIVSGYKSSDPR